MSHPINAMASPPQSSSLSARVTSPAIVVDEVKKIGRNLDWMVSISDSFSVNQTFPRYQSMNKIALFTHTQITPNNHNWAGKLSGNPINISANTTQINDKNVEVTIIIEYLNELNFNTKIINIKNKPTHIAAHKSAHEPAESSMLELNLNVNPFGRGLFSITLFISAVTQPSATLAFLSASNESCIFPSICWIFLSSGSSVLSCVTLEINVSQIFTSSTFPW